MTCNCMRRATALLSLLSLVVFTGCGESTGSVKGKVYLQDKLVTAGSVAFVPPNDKVATAEIRPDGSYEILLVTAGLSKISVTAPTKVSMPAGKMMTPGKMGAADKAVEPAAPKGAVVPIPDKFGDAQKSGLTYVVKSGSQEFDIKIP